MLFSDTAKGSSSGALSSSSDFIIRPATKHSVIRFEKGENEKTCRVTVIDDSLYEEEEKFYLVLHQADGGRIGQNDQTMIIIVPDESDGKSQ